MPTASPTKKTSGPHSPKSTSSRNGDRPELEIFADFCRDALTTNEGGPLLVEPFQRRMLTDYFDGRRSSLIIIAKKNGKTSLLGALALYHLLSTPDAECVIAAASRDQAGIMLRQIRGFIRRAPELSERLDVTQRVISYEKLGGQIRILASDVDTVDGAIPTLVLIDELHRHKHPDVYGVLRDGLGPRNGRMVTISTAGDDEESPLGQLRRVAYAQPGIKRDGAYRFIQGQDFVMHEWALDPEQDRDDLKLVKTANPASWQTVSELRKRHNDPSMMPWQWARFACGVWMAGEEGAISDKEWRECAQVGVQIPEGSAEVIVGVDIGRRVDSTGVVAVWRDDENQLRVDPVAIVAPPGDGTNTPEADIWEPMAECVRRWPTATFVLDPNLGGDIFAERLDREFPSAQVAIFEQVPAALARMAQQTSEAVAATRLRHPDDPKLNAHVLAAGVRQVGEKWRFVKQKRKKMPIDALIAMAMAISVLVAEAEPPPERMVW